LGYRNADRRARGNSARPCCRAPAPDSGTASNGQGHIGVGGQPHPFSRQHGVPQGDTSTQVKIPARGGKLPGTYQVDADLAPSAEQAQGPSGAAQLHPSGVAQGHEALTMDRRLSAVLTHVLAGRTRHRTCRSYGATLTRAATRPRVAAAVGASTRLVAQALLPSNPTTTSRVTIPSIQPGQSPTTAALLADVRSQASDQVELTIGPGSSEAVLPRPSHFLPVPPWWIAQRRAGLYRESRAVQPSWAQVRVRRRRGPSVRRRRRGVCHCASAQPCLHCSPTQAGQTLFGLAIPAGRTRCGRALGRVAPARSSSSCDAGRYACGWGWPIVTDGHQLHHQLRLDSPARPAQIGGRVAGCRVP
jgi:hypothetical protein